MSKLKKIEKLRKKEWRTFLFKKHWFLNLLVVFFLFAFIYQLIALFYPAFFLPEEIITYSFQTEEEALKRAAHRIQEGGLILSFVFGLFLIMSIFYKVYLFKFRFLSGYSAKGFLLDYNNWLVDKFDGRLSFSTRPLDFSIFSNSNLCPSINGELSDQERASKRSLYRSLGYFTGDWKRSTIHLSNVIQFVEYKNEKGAKKREVIFNSLFMAVAMPKAYEGKIIIKRGDSKKIRASKLKRMERIWGSYVPFLDTEFENRFLIFGNTKSAPDYLSAEIRNAMISIQEKLDKNVSISIVNGYMYIDLPGLKGLLYPSLSKKINVKKIETEILELSKFISAINPQRGHAV